MKLLSLVLVVLVAVSWVFCPAHAHELFLGSCPTVTPMPDFDMERFSGLWYVVESFDDREQCLRWNISRDPQDDTWYLREAEHTGVLSSLGLSDTEFTTATLNLDPSDPAKITIKWPLNVAGSYDLTVHATDYENFAGVFQCQEVAFFQRQNGAVLSRTPLLQVHFQQTARLHHPKVQVEYYTKVDQSHCGYDWQPISEGAGSSDFGPLAASRHSSTPEDDPREVKDDLDSKTYDGFSSHGH